ncbi:MAG: Tm-1-like ATP-binding domain-containing protein, partial [Rhodobacteraceae bacterium]|nr:Tm-1-like ATP-binding domain-containing protein [Paracoccaceae bacterium]
MKPVLLLATMETKSEEVGYLHDRLKTLSVPVEIIDISLGSSGENWSTPKKLTQMQEVVGQVSNRLNENLLERASVVVGLGGGTGGEIILQILRDLPFDFPKILITTLPFDPREAVSDNSIILIPTLTDIEGLNSSLRNVLNNTASMLAGLVTSNGLHNETSKSIGLTTLGITQDASRKITCLLRKAGYETTSFHANGYGGAAFTRLAKAGTFYGVIDMTIHEITRIHVAGVHVDMPDRFTATSDLPRIVLPGGLNLIGLGEIDLVPAKYLYRPHYQHSGYFTHVKMSPEEI